MVEILKALVSVEVTGAGRSVVTPMTLLPHTPLKLALLLSLGLAVGSTQALAQAPAAPGPAVEQIADPAAPTVQPAQQLTVQDAIAAELISKAVSAKGATKRRYEGLAKFYGNHEHQPLWIEDGHYSAKAQAVMARLSHADEDGLDPMAFDLPAADFATAPDAPVGDIARADIRLSLAVATFAEQASGGRVVPTSIYKDITRKPETIGSSEALGALTAAADVSAALDGFNPPHQAFRNLKAKLAELRSQPAAIAQAKVELTKTIKPGMTDFGMPTLRTRLSVAEPTDPMLAETYDDALVQAVEAFQSENGLTADGVVGPRTLSILNKSEADLKDDIIANMEMWRWMPRSLSSNYVLVNVPEFMVRVFRDGQKVHEARVVVGKTTNQTPIFSGEMQYLVVNPYWNVPESIKIKEMLPDIQADPAGYFARHGYEATWNGQVIDPATVIWDENAVKAVGIRQVPGEANALGHIKFMFPNQHAVYLHDTPSRKLFGRDVRAFSHGCVRVDDPMSFADAVLAGDPVWNVPKLEALFGGPEQRVDIATHLKVHIAYFTVQVGDDGAVQTWDDIYGHVAKIKAALGLART